MSNSVSSTSASNAQNPIITALDRPGFVVDEKGVLSLSEWGVNDMRLAMSFKLVRGLDRSKLNEFVRDIISEARSRSNSQQELQGYIDMFVMAFHTRDINEGKGERDLFYWFYIELYLHFPKTVIALLPTIPEKFGSYLDFNKLYEMARNHATGRLDDFCDEIVRLYAEQLVTDQRAMTDDKSQKVSLAAKWVPREGGHFGELGKAVAMKIYGSKPILNENGSVKFNSHDDVRAAILANDQISIRVGNDRLKNDVTLKNARISCLSRYRKLVASLNKHISTVEVKMCDPDGCWNDINPGAVPARCLSKNGKAFRNLKKDNTQRSDRFDRVQCAENFNSHLQKAIADPTSVRVHGKNMMPHELVRQFMYGHPHVSNPVVEAQWIDLRERLKESGCLDNFISLVDVSGSMYGIPMEVAIAFGILVSEVATPQFANRFLTFESQPHWHKLDPSWNLYQKVQNTISAPWGSSTNFEAALKMILDACITNKIPADQVAKLTLVVFSDMQFDQAQTYGLNQTYNYTTGSYGPGENFKTKHARIAQLFADAGYVDADTGKGIVPTIIFWNLRGDTLDFPASADTPGVTMVSGFSANGLKGFMDGSLLEMVADKPPTPYEIFRKTIDSERYDSVRQTCQTVGEIKSLSGETYVAPVRETDDVDTELVEVKVDEVLQDFKSVFIQADVFKGSFPGYVFKMGSNGLGYYKDVPVAAGTRDVPFSDTVSSVDDFVPVEMSDAASVATSDSDAHVAIDEKIKTAKKLLAELESLRNN